MNYVAGFLFRQNNSEVALIRKEKPAWQKNRLNGIGGKIEPGERPEDAMVREFQEETGQTLSQWRKFCTLYSPQARVYFFKSPFGDNRVLFSMTEEQVAWYPVRDILDSDFFPNDRGVLFNLRWLIPLALDPEEPNAVIHQGHS